MGTEENYYDILGITKDATDEEIKAAYKRMMKECHPDTHPDDEEAANLAKKLGEAYETLGDSEKRKEYDEKLDDEEEVECEDPEKFYTKEEVRFNHILNLRTLIDEELEKASFLIEYKNEVLSLGLNENIDKREFYNDIKDLISTFSKYISTLEGLKDEAYAYDLMKEEETLRDTIEFFTSEIEEMPRSKRELKEKVEKTKQENKLKTLVATSLEDAKNLIEKFSALLTYAYQRDITVLEYENYKKSISLETFKCLGTLRGYAKICKKIGLNSEYKEIMKSISLLSYRVNSLPDGYEDARTLGFVEYIKEKMKKTLSIWKETKNKIDRITTLFEKYPTSELIDSLLDYCLREYENAIVEFNEIASVISNETITQYKDRIATAQKYSELAKSTYKDANDVHKRADALMKQAKTYKNPLLDDSHILILLQSALAGYNKQAAIDLLVKAESIIGTMKQGEILDEEFNSLYEELKEKLENLREEQTLLKENTYKLQREASPYRGFTQKDFVKHLRKLNIQLAGNWIFGIIFTGGGIWNLINITFFETYMRFIIQLVAFFICEGFGLEELISSYPILKERQELKGFYKIYKNKRNGTSI